MISELLGSIIVFFAVLLLLVLTVLELFLVLWVSQRSKKAVAEIAATLESITRSAHAQEIAAKDERIQRLLKENEQLRAQLAGITDLLAEIPDTSEPHDR
jgi:hypothetical protein